MFKNKQIIGGVAIAGILAVVTLIAPAVDSSLLANTASANYGGGGGTKRVDVCQNGRTIRVSVRAERALLAQGATQGACQTGQVLGAATSTPAQQEELRGLQQQIVTLLQQLLALLQAQK